MFTGIITGVGRIVASHDLGSSLQHGKRLTIVCPPSYLDDVGLGDSIALNGACMTVTRLDLPHQQFSIDISAESLARTTGLRLDAQVNLEKALRAGDRLGGHIVSGHVDGVGTVSHFAQVGESWELRLQAPAELARYLAYKGSITVNGVSLTVNRVADNAQRLRDQHQPDSAHRAEHHPGPLQAGSRRQPRNRYRGPLRRAHARAPAHHPAESSVMSTARPVAISPVEDIVADMRAGRMVILVDEEDRENEGDLVLAADHVTPEAINFMARFGRGLICLTLTRERCEYLRLPPMAARNGTVYSTAFTVSIEAASGVTTGISAADRARTVQAAVALECPPEDLVQPGHIFPLQAVDGGVLMRAGHTEAGCDLAAMAGCSPAAVICEIMKDDGTMARLPDLQLFAAEHGLKIGTIADLIKYRSHTESLIEKVGTRTLNTAFGEFTAHAYRDKPSQGVHLALVRGQWSAQDAVLARVHEPLSVLDALEVGRSMHSWSLDACLSRIAADGRGVVVLLNCGESAEQLLAQFEGTARASHAPERGRMDLRTYGVGAQILRDCGVHKMNLMGNPRRMPSMVGYGLEVAGYIQK